MEQRGDITTNDRKLSAEANLDKETPVTSTPPRCYLYILHRFHHRTNISGATYATPHWTDRYVYLPPVDTFLQLHKPISTDQIEPTSTYQIEPISTDQIEPISTDQIEH